MCAIMAVSGVHRRSGRRSAALPAVLNANVNANGKRAFAFVPSMSRAFAGRGAKQNDENQG